MICGLLKHEYAECINCHGQLGGSYVYAPDFTLHTKELEDKVKVLEDALVDAEVELSYKEAQINILIETLYKAHDLRERLDNATPYRDQPMLPFGDLPE